MAQSNAVRRGVNTDRLPPVRPRLRPGCGILLLLFGPACFDESEIDPGTFGTGTTMGSTTEGHGATTPGVDTHGHSDATSLVDGITSTTHGEEDDDTTSGSTSTNGASQDDTAAHDTGPATNDESTAPSSTEAGDESESCPGNDCDWTIPHGWSGPVVLVDNVSDPCPSAFPHAVGSFGAGVVPGDPVCTCSCSVAEVHCYVHSELRDAEFAPAGPCNPPNDRDDCLSVQHRASCTPNATWHPAKPGWESTVKVCGAPEVHGAMGGKCIHREGEHECPAGWDERSVRYRDIDDQRTCSECECGAEGQSCTVNLEVCGVGFYGVTLVTGDACHQLNSSDGDGVTLLHVAVTNQGRCVPTARSGQLHGDVLPEGPETLCCAAP